MAQAVKRLVLADRQPAATQAAEYVVIVDADGNPVELGAGGGGPSQEEFNELAETAEELSARLAEVETGGDE